MLFHGVFLCKSCVFLISTRLMHLPHMCTVSTITQTHTYSHTRIHTHTLARTYPSPSRTVFVLVVPTVATVTVEAPTRYFSSHLRLLKYVKHFFPLYFLFYAIPPYLVHAHVPKYGVITFSKIVLLYVYSTLFRSVSLVFGAINVILANDQFITGVTSHLHTSKVRALYVKRLMLLLDSGTHLSNIGKHQYRFRFVTRLCCRSTTRYCCNIIHYTILSVVVDKMVSLSVSGIKI